jgi:hypothetical protein
MRRDPAILTALVVLALAAAVAGWLLSGTWIVHGAVHWEAPVSVSTAMTAAR